MSRLPERFWAKVDKRADGCWIWTAGCFHGGYGCFRVGRTARRSHVLAYEDAIGPVENGLYVCHRCDTPACVNPEHLFLGTAKDNSDDRDAKGRTLRGERCSQARLTTAAVVDIRRRIAAGEMQTDIARSYGISKSLVCDINKGRRWRHVNDIDPWGDD